MDDADAGGHVGERHGLLSVRGAVDRGRAHVRHVIKAEALVRVDEPGLDRVARVVVEGKLHVSELDREEAEDVAL